MAWSNRAVGSMQHNPPGSTSATPTITATTAGDLVVFTGQISTTSDPGGAAFTPPAGGWTFAARVYDGSQEQSEVWYLPHVTAGQTTFTFGNAASTTNVVLATFSGGTQNISDTGTNTAGAGTGVTATLSGTSSAGDLVVATFGCRNVGAVTVTWNTPASYTIIDAYAASAAFHAGSFYRLSGAGGAEAVAGSVTTSQNNWTGIAVSFGGPAASLLGTTQAVRRAAYY